MSCWGIVKEMRMGKGERKEWDREERRRWGRELHRQGMLLHSMSQCMTTILTICNQNLLSENSIHNPHTHACAHTHTHTIHVKILIGIILQLLLLLGWFQSSSLVAMIM